MNANGRQHYGAPTSYSGWGQAPQPQPQTAYQQAPQQAYYRQPSHTAPYPSHSPVQHHPIQHQHTASYLPPTADPHHPHPHPHPHHQAPPPHIVQSPTLAPPPVELGPSENYETSVYVGLEDAPPEFRLAFRVIGEKGQNLEYLSRTTKAKVILRGRGTGIMNNKPMHIYVGHDRLEGKEEAESLANNLVRAVKEEYADWLKSTGYKADKSRTNEHQDRAERSRETTNGKSQEIRDLRITRVSENPGQVEIPQGGGPLGKVEVHREDSRRVVKIPHAPTDQSVLSRLGPRVGESRHPDPANSQPQPASSQGDHGKPGVPGRRRTRSRSPVGRGSNRGRSSLDGRDEFANRSVQVRRDPPPPGDLRAKLSGDREIMTLEKSRDMKAREERMRRETLTITTKQKNRDTTSHPVVQSERPVVRSERPVVRSERPVVRSERPVVRSERPIVRSERPELEREPESRGNRQRDRKPERLDGRRDAQREEPYRPQGKDPFRRDSQDPFRRYDQRVSQEGQRDNHDNRIRDDRSHDDRRPDKERDYRDRVRASSPQRSWVNDDFGMAAIAATQFTKNRPVSNELVKLANNSGKVKVKGKGKPSSNFFIPGLRGHALDVALQNQDFTMMPPIFIVRKGFGPVKNYVWVVGDTSAYLAAQRAAEHPEGPNLGIKDTMILWFGYPGLKFAEVFSKMKGKLDRNLTPSTVILHVGGEDLVNYVDQEQELTRDMRDMLTSIKDLLPNTHVSWSNVLPWQRYPANVSPYKMENLRLRVNDAAKHLMRQLKGSTLYHDHDFIQRKDGLSVYHYGGFYPSMEGARFMVQNFNSIIKDLLSEPGSA